MKITLNQTIDDLVRYLYHIKDLAKDLDVDQKKDLQEILRVILTLLVLMRKGSGLGKISLEHILRKL